MSPSATITNLDFKIKSNWDGAGIAEAQADLKALKTQLDDLNSKKIQITADSAQVRAEIQSVKAEINQLNQDVKLGIDVKGAEATIAVLKAKLDELQNKKLTIDVDKSRLDADIAEVKAKMDSLRDKTVKIDADDKGLRATLDDAKRAMDDAQKGMQSAWQRTGSAGQAAALSIWSALLLLMPAIVPLSGAVLALGGAMVSAFGGAAIALGALGVSVKSTVSASSPLANLYTQLANQQQALAGMTQGSKNYTAEASKIVATQNLIAVSTAGMTPFQITLAHALSSLKQQWQGLQQQMEKFTGPLILEGVKIVGNLMRAMVPIVEAVARALMPMMQQLDKATVGAGMTAFVNWIIKNGIPNLIRLITFIVDIGKAVAQMAVAFTSQGAGLTKTLDNWGSALDRWGANGGFTRFADSIRKDMPQIKQALEGLGLALKNVITALSQMGGTSLSTLGILLGLLGSLPVGAIQAFFIAFASYKVIAATTAAVSGMITVVKGVQVAYEAAGLAMVGFKYGLEGTTIAGKDNTVAMLANRVATIAVAVAKGVAAAATWLWNAALVVLDFLISPIGLAIVALGVIIYELVTHWRTVWNTIKQIAADVWQWLQDAWHACVNAVIIAWNVVASALTAAWNAVWNAVKDAGETIWNWLKDNWKAILAAVLGGLIGWALFKYWHDIWDSIKQVASDIWQGLQDAWRTTLNALKSAWDTVSSAVSGAFRSFWDGIRSGFTTLVSDVKKIWGGIVDIFKAPVNLVIGVWDAVAGVVGLPHVNKLAEGGHVRGAGGPTSDSIPAMLSNGEYVVNASAVNHYGVDTMHSLNARKLAGGGTASTGLTGPTSGLGGTGITPAQASKVNQQTATPEGSSWSSALGALTSLPSKALDALKHIVATAAYDVAKPIIDGIESAVPNPIPGITTPAGNVPHDGVKALGDAILNKIKGAQSAAQSAAASVGGTVPTGQHKSDIDAALTKAGIPQAQWPSWESGLNTLITRESGWNASAINLTDSNAQAGHPSQGLMQTIPSTFAAYSLGGSITDPVSNIVAGIRYIMATYGGINNVQQANANLPAKGYDIGGALMPGMTLANNTTGQIEGVLNPTGLAAIGGLGALSSLNTGQGFKSASGGSSSGGAAGGTVVNLNVEMVINANSANAQDVAKQVEKEFDKLAVMLEQQIGSR